MRNKYPGICYRCSKTVDAGKGHFERNSGSWIVQHADCAIKYRDTKIVAPGFALRRMQEQKQDAHAKGNG